MSKRIVIRHTENVNAALSDMAFERRLKQLHEAKIASREHRSKLTAQASGAVSAPALKCV